MTVIKTKKVFDSLTVSSGSKERSEALHVDYVGGLDATLEVDVSGSGTASFRVLMSNSGNEPYLQPATAKHVDADIFTDLGSTRNFAAFDIPSGARAKIEVEETSTTDSVTVDAWLAMRTLVSG